MDVHNIFLLSIFIDSNSTSVIIIDKKFVIELNCFTEKTDFDIDYQVK